MGATVGEVAAVSQQPVSRGETLAPNDGPQAGYLALALRGAVRGPLSGVGEGTFRPEAEI